MKKQKPKKIFAAILMIIFITAFLCVQFAFADGEEVLFKAGISNAYSALRLIGIAAAALGLAGCGIRMITGNEQEAQKAKSAIPYIAAALAMLVLLPLLIRTGKTMFGSGWNPSSLGS